MKIAFDLLCARIADASRAALATKDECSALDEGGRKPLELFCKWYSDGTEMFDWWVLTNYQNLGSEEGYDSVGAEILAGLEATNGHDDRQSLLRSILALGDRLAGVATFLDDLGAVLNEDELTFVKEHCLPGPLRERLNELDRHEDSGAVSI